jgi:hypothetical protein
MQSTNTEIALKTEIARQSGFKKYEEQVGNYNQFNMVKAWQCLAPYNAPVVETMIWEYITSHPSGVWWKGESHLLGELTHIAPYTDKKGVSKPAHFSANDHYAGSVKELGDEPMSYTGNFKISPIKFNLNLAKLADLRHMNGAFYMEHLFAPKPELAVANPEKHESVAVKAFKQLKEAKEAEKKAKPVKKTAPKKTAHVATADSDSEDEPIGNKLVRQNAVRK